LRRLLQDWRTGLTLVLLLAIALRTVFFVGFALGDDVAYIGHVTTILGGHYPPLEPLNQYAYRPLLLYLFAAGVALFGYTDFGIVVPVLAASLATVLIVHAFVRRLINPGAAVWCALLFACEPFDVVNSTTMTNDVILSCLIFAAVSVFMVADEERRSARMRLLCIAGGILLVCAFLIKITLFPVLLTLGVYSLASLRARASVVWRGHTFFYLTFLLGLACICGVYYLKTGDPFWQFRSEFQYYDTFKPDSFVRGDINYAALMSEYPKSLFGVSGYDSFRFLDHGALFWLFVPAAVWALVSRNRILSFLVMMAVAVFLFFEFYPQYLTPRYLPLVRQTRYLELLLPPVVVVVGVALHRLGRTRPLVASLVLAAVLGDFVYEASRRWLMFDDSQQDMRALAEYASTTIKPSHRGLSVDRPASTSLQFYLHDGGVPITLLEHQPPDDSYVAIGGARSFWWSNTLTFDVRDENVPAPWVLTYRVSGRRAPWRRSDLRVYYVRRTPIVIRPVRDDVTGCTHEGLRQVSHPDGFSGPPAVATDVTRIPDLDNAHLLPAAHLEWTGSLHAADEVYTLETTSDDGSWVYLNDQLVLDNGGTHPARNARAVVRLQRGQYAFRLRYEDTGGDHFLRFRVHPGEELDPPPAAFPQFCNGS
jgi:4-amino-4-deoxy-L-arabinose transferase-like glycosyltransferase